jgi:3-hydroxyisobutyrate dehydrogenase-like beta-hydroxyacid dehydrogenase
MSLKVSVAGMGRMGSALATALFRKGFSTTVWNRSPSKTEPLARLGLRVAGSLEEAARVSDVVVIIVSDYATAQQLLQDPGVVSALSGKVLVQLGTGTPQEARQMESWANQRNISYLDGAIMSYPSGIGAPECTIFYSGSEQVFDRLKPVLTALGGNTLFVGKAIGHASALDMAGLAFVLSTMFGFLEGYIVCKEEGLPPEAFMESVKSMLPTIEGMLGGISTRIQSAEYTGNEATIEAWSVGPRELMAWCKEHGMGHGIARAQHHLFEQATKAGRAQDDFAYFYEIMRKADT